MFTETLCPEPNPTFVVHNMDEIAKIRTTNERMRNYNWQQNQVKNGHSLSVRRYVFWMQWKQYSTPSTCQMLWAFLSHFLLPEEEEEKE